MNSPPLPSKFRPHTSLRDTLSRPRLVTQCLEGAPASAHVTLIVGPAGFGKTTVLGEIRRQVEADGGRTVWLNCDDRDRDVDGFLESVSQAMQQYEPGLRVVLRTPEDLGQIFTARPLRIALFVDEYEAAASEQLNDAIEVMARTVPDNVRIFVAGRVVSPQRFIALELDGFVRLVDSSALRFSDLEAQSLLARQIPPDNAAELIAQADGWPFVLQLLRLNAAARARTGAEHRTLTIPRSRISNFLAAEVMASLDESLRTFVIETSLLEVVNVCDAEGITGRVDSASLVRKLEPLAPIVTIEQEPLAARFHPLFQEYLRSQLETRGRAEVIRMQERLARHFARTHRVYEAVRCAVGAESIDLAIAILEGAGAIRFAIAQGVSETRRILQLLPKAAIRGRLRLRLMEIESSINNERAPTAERELAELEAELASGGFAVQFDGAATTDLAVTRFIVAYIDTEHRATVPDWATLRATTTVARATFRDDERVWLVPLVTELQLLLRQGSLAHAAPLIDDYIAVSESNPGPRSSIDAAMYRACYELARGELDTSATRTGRLLARCLNLDGHEEGHAGQLGHALLGQIRYLHNDMRGAVSHFDSIPARLSHLYFDVYSAKHVWLALCDAAAGHLDSALDRLAAAIALGTGRQLPHLVLLAVAVRADLFATHRESGRVLDTADRETLGLAWDHCLVDDSHPWITRVWVARALVSTLIESEQRPAHALSLAQQFVQLSETCERPLVKASALIILARALLADADRVQARKAVERALILTEGTGASRPFLDQGAEIIILVRELAEDGARPGAQWARQIATRARAFDLLTPRQKAVLRELAKHQSTKEIARALTLSPRNGQIPSEGNL